MIENTTKIHGIVSLPLNEMTYDSAVFETAVLKPLRLMKEQHINERIWDKDSTLENDVESRASISAELGWLNIIPGMVLSVPSILQFAREVGGAGFTLVVHIGMGGSSLASLLFVEASKSMTTAETNAIFNYIDNKLRTAMASGAGTHFVAITDPDMPLVYKVRILYYKHILMNFEDIGNCYSAPSYFGIVSAALLGPEVGELPERTLGMQKKRMEIKFIPSSLLQIRTYPIDFRLHLARYFFTTTVITV